MIKPFELGRDYVDFGNNKIYYDSNLGLSDYQSILVRHQDWAHIGKMSKVNTVIDVGANVGFFSLLMRDMFPKSTIYAIEPIPRIAEALRNNFVNDPNTTQHLLAISDSAGIVKLAFDESVSGKSTISQKGRIEARTQTLDEFARKNNIHRVDVLKIDAETFEAHVLRRGTATLQQTRYLFIEITIKDNPNYTLSSIMKLLYGDGYDFQLIAMRNYADKSDGEAPVLDCLMKNVVLEPMPDFGLGYLRISDGLKS